MTPGHPIGDHALARKRHRRELQCVHAPIVHCEGFDLAVHSHEGELWNHGSTT